MTLDVRSLALQVLVCSQLTPVLPLGGCISMWVVAHTIVVAVYCFSLCVAVFFTALPPRTYSVSTTVCLSNKSDKMNQRFD